MGNEMDIFMVIIEDTHCDVTAHPFTCPIKAVEQARKVAKKYARDESDIEEKDYGKDDGWIFYANYSCESHVRVVKTELNKNAV